MTHHAAEVEGRTDDPIFLSPRVVDSAAFERFASALRALVGRAAEQERALGANLARSEAALRQLAAAGPVVESRVGEDRASLSSPEARLSSSTQADGSTPGASARLRSMDSRVEDPASSASLRIAALVEHAVGRIEAAAAHAVLASLDAGEAAAEEINRARKDIAAIREESSRWASDLSARVTQAEERVAALSGPALRSITAITDRAAVVLGRDPTAEDEAPASPGSLADLTRRAELARDDLAGMIDRSASLVAGFTERQATLASALLDALRKAEEARDALENRARELAADVEASARSAPAAEPPSIHPPESVNTKRTPAGTRRNRRA